LGGHNNQNRKILQLLSESDQNADNRFALGRKSILKQNCQTAATQLWAHFKKILTLPVIISP
jgi:thioredoxin-like negative regulator of GroEL